MSHLSVHGRGCPRLVSPLHGILTRCAQHCWPSERSNRDTSHVGTPSRNVRKTCSDVSSIHRKVRSINTFSTSHVDVMCITNIRNQHAADISCGWCRLRPYAIVLALHGWLTLSASSEGGSNGLERTLQQQGGRDRRDRGRPSCWRTVRLPVGHITVIL